MSAILESPPPTLSMAELAGISQTLAEQVSRFPLRREGFTVSDYLSIGGPCVEFVNGVLQVLAMPDALHQAILVVLHGYLGDRSRVDPEARTVVAPFPVYLTPTVYREPDVGHLLGRNAARRHRTHWDGANVVFEIISGSDRGHDEVTKWREYAAAGVPEYWMVDPDVRTVRVLTLPPGGTAYAVHGEFGAGQTAASVLLAGFGVGVADLFADADRLV